MLTDRYLLDAFRIAGDDGRDRDMIWVVHALGSAELAAPDAWQKVALDGPLAYFGDAHTRTVGAETAEVTVVQRLALDDPAKATLPRAWYDRKVGVRVSLLGGPKTQFYVATTPTDDPENKKLKDPAGYVQLKEVGGTSIIARRSAAETCFVALAIPFEGGSAPAVRVVEHPTGNSAVIAVEVTVERGGAHDWLLLDLRDEAERREPCALDVAGCGRFLFADHAFVRIAGTTVDACGDIRGLTVKTPAAEPVLRHNGRTVPFTVEGGDLIYESRHQ
jgi:hypothetical protein